MTFFFIAQNSDIFTLITLILAHYAPFVNPMRDDSPKSSFENSKKHRAKY